MIRARLVVKGDVQGVGLRAYIKRVARVNKIKGVVRNLEDDTVEIYCECKNMDMLNTFRSLIEKKKRKNKDDIFSPNVEEIEVYEEIDPKYKTGREPKEFKAFYIEYGKFEDESLIREEIGSLLLVDTRDKVIGMHEDMNKSFQRIDEKYSHFSKKLDELIVYFKKFVDAYTKKAK